MSKDNQLSDDQLLLYSRQIMLPQIDIQGQEKLLAAKAVIFGVGGLGCPALLYLAASGIGEITIVDDDVVELSNVQRQILFSANDVGRKKTTVARERIKLLQTNCKVNVIDKLPDDAQLATLIKPADVVLDGTDNFNSRYRHNLACVQTRTPLVSGAVIRFEGQVTVFNNQDMAAPCYHCLYPDAQDEQENCSENGVLGPVAGMVASVMATEAIKVIVNIGQPISERLLLLDALAMEWRTVKFKQDPNCPVCKTKRS